MKTNDLTYWVGLASIPQMWTRRKNEILAKAFLHQPKYSIGQLMETPKIWEELSLSESECEWMEGSRLQLPQYAFMVENLLNQGYHIVPITSPEYPQELKRNLKYHSPIVVYAKGNIELLNQPSVAIVGSRSANEHAISFTDKVSRKVALDERVVVSGFAKGVDRQALDSALAQQGRSIIVLPQGITTFTSGYLSYYQPIARGEVTVISVFSPDAPWNKGLAMARNSIIYGMASEIYVAQSDSKGGTWEGVLDGLKKGRKIFVRVPQHGEKIANNLLIQQGATAVDQNGDVLTTLPCTSNLNAETEIEKKITAILEDGQLSAKSISVMLKGLYSGENVKAVLKAMPSVEEVIEKHRIYYRLKGSGSPSLFD